MPPLSKEEIIKSKNRVRDQGEVFTQHREVKNILKLTAATSNRYWRFLEPACGNGNFLVEIVRQRLEHMKHDPSYRTPDRREYVIARILSTIYGVDIAEDNIAESKKRIMDEVFKFSPKKSSSTFLLTMQNILDTNIQLGDMLNGKENVFFVQYSFLGAEYMSRCKIKREVFALTDMENDNATPRKIYPLALASDVEPISLADFQHNAQANIDTLDTQTTLFNAEAEND